MIVAEAVEKQFIGKRSDAAFAGVD